MNTYYIYYQRKQYFLRESHKYLIGLNTSCRPGYTMVLRWYTIPCIQNAGTLPQISPETWFKLSPGHTGQGSFYLIVDIRILFSLHLWYGSWNPFIVIPMVLYLQSNQDQDPYPDNSPNIWSNSTVQNLGSTTFLSVVCLLNFLKTKL